MAALLGPDSWWTTAGTISIGFGAAAAQPWTMWLSFAIFWALNIVIILWGMEAIKRFECWAAPFLIVVFLALMVWMVVQAGGLGPVVEETGTVGWGPEFWAIFPISLMGMIAFWSTLSLNMPDFTRFGRSQRDQVVGPDPRPAHDDDAVPARRRPDHVGHGASCSARRSGTRSR